MDDIKQKKDVMLSDVIIKISLSWNDMLDSEKERIIDELFNE